MLKRLPESIIDFHVHLFPDRLFEAIWKRFLVDYQWDVQYHFYYRECVDYLEGHGVSPLVYSNYAHRKGIARGLNEWNMKVLDELPGLYCFAAYHPDDEDAVEMAEEVLRHPGVLGFKLQLLVQRFPPHDRRLYPMYEMVIREGKRVLLHAGNGPVGNEFVGISHFRRLMADFPDLPVTVAHMGGMEFGEFSLLLDEFPNLYFDTAFAFMPRLPLRFDQGNDYLEAHRERILYGSDFPNLIFPREEEINYLLGLDLSQEFYDSVFRDNGLELIRRHSGRTGG